jgi:hypothetical protein
MSRRESLKPTSGWDTRQTVTDPETADGDRARVARVEPAMRAMRRTAAAVVALGLLALGGCPGGSGGSLFSSSNITFPNTDCTAADTWVLRGLESEHFPSTLLPSELLAATLRRGDVVRLRLTTKWTTGCDSAVAAVEWLSTAPGVATGAASGPLAADLTALATGESRVSARATLASGERVTAELHAVPSPGSPELRVYLVRVVS